MATSSKFDLPPDLQEFFMSELRARQNRSGFLGDEAVDALPVVEAEEEGLFVDHDNVRGHGRGAYVFDAEEAASRSVDLSASPDPAFEPIPMPAADRSSSVMLWDLEVVFGPPL